MKKMFVGGLPLESTEETVTEMFTEYGKVRSIKLASDVFTGKCKGFGFIEMEGHEARAAIAGLNGRSWATSLSRSSSKSRARAASVEAVGN